MPYTIEDYRRELAEEALATLPISEILKHASSEERLQGLAPEERLAGLSREQIFEYLKKLDSQHKKRP